MCQNKPLISGLVVFKGWIAIYADANIVLASSMKLEYPVNGVLPSTEHARDRLLAKIFRHRYSGGRARSMSDEDFALLYAYGILFQLSFASSDS
jgi:hypothetical protein